MRAVVDMFGKTPRENSTAYSLNAIDTYPRTLYRPPAKTKRAVNRVDALFSFPKSVAYVCVSEDHWDVLDANTFSTNTRPVGSGSKQRLTVFVYDREFFVKTLNYYVTTQRKTMEWFKAACEAEDMSKLPKYPGQDTVSVNAKNEEGVLFAVRSTEKKPRLVFTAMRPTSGPPTYGLFHTPLPDLAESIVGSASVLKPTYESLANPVTLDEFASVPVPLACPNGLLSELRSRLVQEYFPSADKTISFIESRTGQFEPILKAWVFKSHSWEGDNGEAVTIYNTHTQIVKKAKKKL
jgi:hypothetical protein